MLCPGKTYVHECPNLALHSAFADTHSTEIFLIIKNKQNGFTLILSVF